eukprot:m.74528 g.74528  ORF g.74528 m.74528 type:complete len:74 (+) comp11804_c0_seq1:752-973(+)
MEMVKMKIIQEGRSHAGRRPAPRQTPTTTKTPIPHVLHSTPSQHNSQQYVSSDANDSLKRIQGMITTLREALK